MDLLWIMLSFLISQMQVLSLYYVLILYCIFKVFRIHSYPSAVVVVNVLQMFPDTYLGVLFSYTAGWDVCGIYIAQT